MSKTTASDVRLSQPAVPLIIRSDDPSHPGVIFDRFSDDFSLYMPPSSQVRIISQHRHLCELFMHRFAPDRLLMPLLPLMCFPFPGFSAEGNSFEMGLWVSLWLAAHAGPQSGNICCTGTVCSKTGNIGRVSRLDEKIAAALNTGFTTCLVPAKDFDKTLFAGDSRVVAVNDIDELNEWLLQNTGMARQTRRVVGWLQSDRQTPSPDDFAIFFSQNVSNENEPAAYWKSLLRQQPPYVRRQRLQRLVREYCTNTRTDPRKTLAFLPVSFRFACLPWLLQEMLRDTPAAAESLYLTFSRRFAESSPEIYHASRFLIEKPHVFLLAQSEFTDVRHRFPLLLWLFFREPSEMLLAFSLLRQLNGIEKALLQKLVSLLDRYAPFYATNSSRRRIDTWIMQKVLKLIDGEAHFREGPVLTIRKRLLYLWQAAEGFTATGATAAASLCRRLLDLHLEFLTARAAPGLDLAATFVRGDLEKLAVFPAMQDLLHAAGTPDAIKRLPATVPDPFKTCKRAIHGRSPDLLWLPQPGISCLRAILCGRWPELNFSGLIRQFTGNSYRTPATELREACLAYWAGAITSHYASTAEAIIKEKSYRHAGNLRLPYLAGWLRQKFQSEKVLPCSACRHLLSPLEFPLESLFWLLFLPSACQPCIRSKLLERYSFSVPVTVNEQLRRKHEIFLSLMQTLLEPDGSTPENSLWLASLADCDKNPAFARRTVQALAPLYYLLSGDRRKACRHVRRGRHLVNNSEFALAFLLRFTRLGKSDYRVQPVPELSLSVEKHLLDSLTLGYYHLFKPKLFSGYLLSEVDDLANLQLISS